MDWGPAKLKSGIDAAPWAVGRTAIVLLCCAPAVNVDLLLRRFDGSIFRPASVICTSVQLAALLSAPPGPEQDCQNDRPNDAPADPRDGWVSRLPFEDLPMDGH